MNFKLQSCSRPTRTGTHVQRTRVSNWGMKVPGNTVNHPLKANATSASARLPDSRECTVILPESASP